MLSPNQCSITYSKAKQIVNNEFSTFHIIMNLPYEMLHLLRFEKPFSKLDNVKQGSQSLVPWLVNTFMFVEEVPW